MPLLETKGAASAQGLGLTLGGGGPVYIEDVFSTYLYTGNGSTQTITNGIDLAGKGGMLWTKVRNTATQDAGNVIVDTVRGKNSIIYTNSTAAAATATSYFSSFDSSGFTAGSSRSVNGEIYVSWTFRKQPKFFDVVTYTGNGANRTIAHSLGSVPGCIIVKRTDTTADWQVYHRSLTNTEYLVLNTTAAKATGATRWNSTTPTSTVFSLGTDTTVNANGGTYVAYLFAHDAGGFGLTGTDNVISCGSFTTSAYNAGQTYNASVNLGYEPQYILCKASSAAVGNWFLADNMRGMPVDSKSANLVANTTAAESSNIQWFSPNATGFQTVQAAFDSSTTYIYIAIRRGPMKTPTSGTSVFGLNARTGTGANATVTGGAGVSDAVLIKNRGAAVGDLFSARLTGTGYLETSSTAAEVAAGTTILQANPWDVMDGVKVGTTSTITNASSNTYINYLFDRAPGFFDVVCYTGTGSDLTVNHNLGVTPELILTIPRSPSDQFAWGTMTPAGQYSNLRLYSNGALTFSTGITRTSTTYVAPSSLNASVSATKYVAYLFASCPGVSKVGSYTGTGALQTVNCGFTGGARFVLIKRTDSTGDWWVYDSARGITSGNDPYLFLNSTDAEVTSTNYVDTDSTGFKVTAAAPAGLNASGGTYIFLAIA